MFWGQLLLISLSSTNHISVREDFIERHIKTRNILQRTVVNEESSSKDFVKRGVVIEKFIRRGSNLRKICQEVRLVIKIFIKTRSDLLQNISVDIELSSKDLSRRWDVIGHFLKTWKCCWKTSPREELLSGDSSRREILFEKLVKTDEFSWNSFQDEKFESKMLVKTSNR